MEGSAAAVGRPKEAVQEFRSVLVSQAEGAGWGDDGGSGEQADKVPGTSGEGGAVGEERQQWLSDFWLEQ